MNLANKHSKKLATLISYARTRIVRTTGLDRPALGPDRPVAQFGIQLMPPCLLVELSEPKATNSM
jgi:hypothetical protein